MYYSQSLWTLNVSAACHGKFLFPLKSSIHSPFGPVVKSGIHVGFASRRSGVRIPAGPPSENPIPISRARPKKKNFLEKPNSSPFSENRDKTKSFQRRKHEFCKRYSKNYAEAARTMSKETGALELRRLATLADVSKDQSNTIVFAMPLEHLAKIPPLGMMKPPRQSKTRER